MKPVRLYACVFICLAALGARGRAGGMTPAQGAKADELIASLERAEGPSSVASTVTRAARRLPAGDVRTDIETAARLLELAARTENNVNASCEDERPGAYRAACESSGAWTMKDVLLRKARLHVAWARAGLRRERGLADAETGATLSIVAAERALERRLAAEALAALRRLGGGVFVYGSYGAFAEGRSLARVPFKRFSRELGETSARVGRLLAWLPESELKTELRGALQTYRDGGYWWGKIHCSAVVRAGDDCLPAGERATLGGAFLATLPYTVAVNWRNADRHLTRAEKILNALPKGERRESPDGARASQPLSLH